MRTIIFLSCLCLLCSCSYGSKTMKNVTSESIKEFAHVGQSTNCDILRKMKEPILKITFTNGKFVYCYVYIDMTQTMLDSLASGASSMFSKVYVMESSDFDKTMNGAFFTFDAKNKTLSEFEKMNSMIYRVVSKYQFMDLPMEPELSKLKELSDEDFLKKITPGMQKGTVFRIIGKPYYTFERNGEEWWIFPERNVREGIDEQDKKSVADSKDYTRLLPGVSTYKMIRETVEAMKIFKAALEGRQFNIMFKDNVVIDRAVSRNEAMTPEEKVCFASNADKPSSEKTVDE